MFNTLKGRRDLLITVVGRAASSFGDGVALIALVLRLQGDGAPPYEVALLLGLGGVPMVALARPVGRLVDAHDSRRLLLMGGLVEVAATIPLVFVHAFVPMLALVVVLGGAAAVTGATWSALMPLVAGEDHLAEAVSAQQSASTLALVGAPAAGGLLAGAFGSGAPVAIDAATFLIVTVAALLVRARRRPDRAATPGQSHHMPGGFGILRADHVLAPLLAGVATVVLLVGMVDVISVYLIRGTLHAGGIWYGFTEACWMAGMVGGSLGASRLRAEPGQVSATIGGAALACAALAGFAVTPAVWVLVPLSVLGGVGNGYAGACMSTLLMARTPDSARGRISATANAVLGGSQGASLILGGLLASLLSPREIYGFAGLLGLAAAGVVALAHASPHPQPAAAEAAHTAATNSGPAGSTGP